jgi:regulator of protease activity HflC (stomatin/prohibitin superfamily)
MIGLILVILFSIFFIAFVIVIITSFIKRWKRPVKLVSSILLVVFFIAFIVFFTTIRSVDTQEVAVVTRFGEVIDFKNAGFYTTSPVNKFHKFDTKTQEIRYDGRQHDEVSFYSKDSQPVESSLTVQYKIDILKAEDIYRTYGTLERLDSVISSLVVERTKSALSTYSAEDLIAQREALSGVIQLSISTDITTKNYPVILTAVYLTNFDFSDAFEAAVEAKMIAEQEKLKAETEKQIAIIKAEQELEIAKINA